MEDRAYLVDLPGYGYARGAPKGRAFESLTQAYENLVDFPSHVIERVIIK